MQEMEVLKNHEESSVIEKYEQETGNQISVASVVTSNNYQYYAESFQFLLDLGIKN